MQLSVLVELYLDLDLFQERVAELASFLLLNL